MDGRRKQDAEMNRASAEAFTRPTAPYRGPDVPNAGPAPVAVSSLPMPVAAPPVSVGRYEIIYPIAAGGMASVYAARLSGMAGFERLFALKVIHPHLAAEPSFIEMFLDEARLAGRIQHPHVAEIFEVGEDRGLYFMVVELVLGQDLRRLMETAASFGRPVPRPPAARLIADIAAGLHEAHELKDEEGEPLGLVHRDVSTRNILVSYQGRAKLIDFGVAWSRGRTHHTRDGAQKGKIGYMPPEQLRGKSVDRRADIYALGVVLYTITLGRHPFPYENEGEQVEKMLAGDFPAPHIVDPSVAPALEAIILKAMSQDPQRRFQTAKEMEEALTAYSARTVQGNPAEQISSLMRELFDDEMVAHETQLKHHRKQGNHRPISAMRPDSAPSRVTAVTVGEADVDTWAPVRRASKRRIVGIWAGIAALTAIALGWFQFRPARASDPAAESLSAVSAHGDASGKQPSPPKAAPAPPEEPAPPVTVSFTGLDADSTIYIDDRETSLPILLPVSSETVRVRITTPGKTPFETELVPLENRTVDVRQAPLKEGKRPSRRSRAAHVSPGDSSERAPSKPAKPTGAAGKPEKSPLVNSLEGWEDNPFL